MKPKLILLTRSLLVALWLALSCVQAQPVSADPDSVKTAYLVNFFRYANWPKGSVTASQTMNLCVLDQSSLGGKIAQLQGKQVGAQTLEVKPISDPSAVRHCQMVFVGLAHAKRLSEVVRYIKGQAVLLVSDVPDAARNGAAIELIEADDRIRMIVNRQNAEYSGITFSAQLLRLALAVY
jgi:YfiR/HmsC-like